MLPPRASIQPILLYHAVKRPPGQHVSCVSDPSRTFPHSLLQCTPFIAMRIFSLPGTSLQDTSDSCREWTAQTTMKSKIDCLVLKVLLSVSHQCSKTTLFQE